MKRERERATIDEAILIIGLPIRTVQAMAARGEIPGAAKFGRRWTFDLKKLRQMIKVREDETVQKANRMRQPIAVGRVVSLAANGPAIKASASPESTYTQVIRRLRDSAKEAEKRARDAKA